jgi:hypothetical protein
VPGLLSLCGSVELPDCSHIVLDLKACGGWYQVHSHRSTQLLKLLIALAFTLFISLPVHLS